jgi:hypothetical protein
MSETTTTKTTKKKAAPPQAPAGKAVAVREQAAPPSTVAYDPSEWGAPQMTSKDIVIPKIFAMQPMSKLVTEGKVKFGEFIDSLTSAVLGDVNNPIEFVPFYMEKCYVVMEEKAGKFSFKQQVPITAANESTDFEQTGEGGVKQKWYRTSNFYVLLPKEIAEGTAIPYLISFRSSSARAGQKLATTMFMKNLKAGKTPAAMVLKLTGTKTTNDKGTFIVMDVQETRPSTDSEVTEAFGWVKTVRSGAVKVDHSDLEQEASASYSAPVDESAEY